MILHPSWESTSHTAIRVQEESNDLSMGLPPRDVRSRVT